MSNYPEVAINKYVWRQFQLAKPTIYNAYKTGIPIFPVSDNLSGDSEWGGKTYIIYDSFAKPRSVNKGFYPIKSAQMMYSIKGDLTSIYEWRDFIINVLDREDIAARDVNSYAPTVLNDMNFYFHSICAYQMNYIGNTTEASGTVKDFATNIIIRYDYHITNIYNN
jgi:hypothetical protein